MYICIDIGGTKTLIAVFDQNKQILDEVKVPTPQIYEEFLEAVKTEIHMLSHHDYSVAVVAAPGRVDHENGLVLAFGNLPWKDVPLKADMANILGVPVTIENDAKIAALAEATELIGAYSKVLYVTISTGIGTGLVVDGELETSIIDSEAGQMLIEHEGTLQKWEDFASGKAIVAKYGMPASEIQDPIIWKNIAKNIYIGLNTVVANTQPDCVVFGGGAGSHLERFKDFLEAEFRAHQNDMIDIPVLLPAKNPEKAVIYGCFLLANRATNG